MIKWFALVTMVLLAACTTVQEKVFVANEDDGSISVIDAGALKEIDRVSLSMGMGRSAQKFTLHNVQVAGDLVLVTVNAVPEGIAGQERMQEMQGASDTQGQPDQLVVMDARTHRILYRVDLDVDAHLAHVVSDGRFAYVTSTEKDLLYQIDLKARKLVSVFDLPKGSMPHGLRLSPDGGLAVIAGMGKSMVLLNLDTNMMQSIPLPGKGVQAAVVGGLAFVSVYDTKQVAVYDIRTSELSYIDLPGAKGLIQMYPSPDGRFLYVADQGAYFDQPQGDSIYKLDISKREVSTIFEKVGLAPHGVAVSPDGRIWVTNLKGNSVSVLDENGTLVEIKVGASPNGVSWYSAR